MKIEIRGRISDILRGKERWDKKTVCRLSTAKRHFEEKLIPVTKD